jgi:hypothetical protein
VKVLVYVEGPGDRAALEALLKPIIESASTRRIGVRFLPASGAGVGKDWLLSHVGRKAAGHLSENPEDWVFALPDLYPMANYRGTMNAHESFEQLKDLLERRFEESAKRLAVPHAVRNHFQVHCLKHDLEVLLLSALDPLRRRLRTKDSLKGRWRNPVEEQDDDKPPKRIIEELFKRYQKRGYDGPVDAPWILERASLGDILNACPQRFAPFVAELRRVTSS